MVRRREIVENRDCLSAGRDSQLRRTWRQQAGKPAYPHRRRRDRQPATASAAAGNGPAKPFDYAWLKGQARFLASSAFQPSKDVLPPAMAALGYDQYQSLRFRTDHSLWGDAGSAVSPAVLPCRPRLLPGGASLRSQRRPSARDSLRPGDVRVRQGRHRSRPSCAIRRDLRGSACNS